MPRDEGDYEQIRSAIEYEKRWRQQVVPSLREAGIRGTADLHLLILELLNQPHKWGMISENGSSLFKRFVLRDKQGDGNIEEDRDVSSEGTNAWDRDMNAERNRRADRVNRTDRI